MGDLCLCFMPFGLKNVGETFQREMDHAFKYLIGKFMADYQDDLTIHSKVKRRAYQAFKRSF
jgi:hypothetical protein